MSELKITDIVGLVILGLSLLASVGISVDMVIAYVRDMKSDAQNKNKEE